MRKTLITYVKPHVQEDPLAMILGITYLGACLEKEKLPVELVDERVVNDQYMKQAIERNDVIGFGALTPNIRRAIAWAKYAKEKGKITVMGGPHASVDQGIFLDSGHFDTCSRARPRRRCRSSCARSRRTTTRRCRRSRARRRCARPDWDRQPGAAADQEARRAAAAGPPPAADGELLQAQPGAADVHLHDARLSLQVHLLPEGAHRPRLPRALDAA
jgi:hypothetical protein